MKANNKEEAVETTTAVAKAEPLVQVVSIEKQFKHLSTKIQTFDKYALELVIDSEEKLTVAENNSGEINTLLKGIDKVRKEFQEPYYETVQAINAFAKTLTIPLDKAKKSVNDEITNWKRTQAAAMNAEAERITKKAEALADEKAEEADRLHRIESQLIARLYGGHWFNANSERKSSAGCLKTGDCDILLNIIQEKVPSAEDFTHLKDEYATMKKGILKKLSQHKSSIIELESDSKTIKINAEKKIAQAKEEAGIEVNTKKDNITQEIIKEAKTEIKSAKVEAKEAGKGVRKNLKFEAAEFEEIPEEWLMLDETKVREWASQEENKAKIKEMLKKGEHILNGVKFWLEDKYVSR